MMIVSQLHPVGGAAAATAQPAVFYVAPGGLDTNPGSIDRPFATLERARDEIRSMKADVGGLPAGGVRVVLRGGEHQRSEPFVVEPMDSGTAECPIVYEAHPGERPILMGGRRITGLERGDDGVFRTTIPEARGGGWSFRQLHVNGERRTLARSPNRGYLYMAGSVEAEDSPEEGQYTGCSRRAFRARPGDVRAWESLEGVSLKLFQSWWTSLLTIASVDEDSGIVRLAGPSRRPLPTRQPQPYIVQNHPGALDAPGEWQLDRDSGELAIIPVGEEDLTAAEVIAPVAERLVLLQGDPNAGEFVEHVTFRGISLQHIAWTLPPEGFADVQAAVKIDAAVHARGARHCAFEGCEVAHTGGYGIWLRYGSQDCRIAGCHLHDLGAGGVKLGETWGFLPGLQDEADWREEHRCRRNAVENCFIHNGGHEHGSGVGVWIGASPENLVANNEICDFWYTGVSVGWCWSPQLGGARDNHIMRNHIHHVMQRLDDGGGIYTLGLQPGTVVGHNHIHHIGREGRRGQGRTGNGVYLDGGSVGILVEGNVIHDTQGGAVRMQSGTGCNIIVNNICAFAARYQIELETARTNGFAYNVVYWDRGRLFRKNRWANYEKYIHSNVYYRAGGRPVEPLGMSWDEWREQRATPSGPVDGWPMDRNSTVADPQFADPAARDLTLAPSSPAFERGFTAIDMDAIGLQGDAQWRQLPESVRVPIVSDDDLIFQFQEDFEWIEVGARPPHVLVVEEADVPEARVRVTDERAASGSRSLRFTNRPGQASAMNPHIYVSPRVDDGAWKFAFDLWIGADAEPEVKWQDHQHGSPFVVGPNLHVDAERRLVVNDEERLRVPEGEWLHVEMTCALGDRANGRWRLDVTLPGGETRELPDLPCPPEFRRLDWLAVISAGEAAGSFYLDNLEFALLEGDEA